MKQEAIEGSAGGGRDADSTAVSTSAAASVVHPNAEPEFPRPLPASRKTAILFSRSSSTGKAKGKIDKRDSQCVMQSAESIKGHQRVRQRAKSITETFDVLCKAPN